ncbi:MAG: hypothetical protein RR416_04265 [Clostridia bacterium]
MNKPVELSLHFLAKQAKLRLRSNEMQESEVFGSICKLNSEAYEDILYDKMISVFESREEILNPLDRIIDHRLFDKCDEIGKQRCMLEASKTYIKLKKRYDEINSRQIG